MKLTLKLATALFVGVLVVLTVEAWLGVRRELALFEDDMRGDQLLLARALAGSLSGLNGADGGRTANDILARAGADHVRVRLLDLMDPSGDLSLAEGRREALITGRELSFRDGRDPPDGRLTTLVPVRLVLGRLAAVEVSESLRGERIYVEQAIRLRTFAILLLAVLCGVANLALGVWVVGRPVRRLVEQARAVGEGRLGARIDLKQGDELGTLAAEMNRMTDLLGAATTRASEETEQRIAALEQLRHADRLTTVGKLASGVAHELGTPLNVVAARGKLIASGQLPPEEVPQNGRIIAEQAERMTAIIRQLLDFARQRGPTRQPTDLLALARQVLTVLEPIAGKRGVTLELAPSDELTLPLDPGQIQQVATNLVMNAIQAMQQQGRVTLAVKRVAATDPSGRIPAGTFARLSVTDQGAGIPADVLPRIFEPFFTTKGVGEGTGLGLSVSHGIVEEHGGFVTVESAPGAGSTFHVHLPLPATA